MSTAPTSLENHVYNGYVNYSEGPPTPTQSVYVSQHADISYHEPLPAVTSGGRHTYTGNVTYSQYEILRSDSRELFVSKLYVRRILLHKVASLIFDGKEISEAPLDRPAAFSMMVSLESGETLSAGGLGTYNTIYSDILSYGSVMSSFEADRDYLVLIAVPYGQAVEVVDPSGHVTNKIYGVDSFLLPKGWKLVSRNPFTAVILPI